MDFIDLESLKAMLSTQDIDLVERMRTHLHRQPPDPVLTALFQVAFTSLYRDRTGSADEYAWALQALRRTLLAKDELPRPVTPAMAGREVFAPD